MHFQSLSIPKIYAYTLPEYQDIAWSRDNPDGTLQSGRGYLKVGYTTREVKTRIKEQVQSTKRPDTRYKIVYEHIALTQSGRAFRDSEVHKRLQALGVQRIEGEWFAIEAEELSRVVDSILQERDMEDMALASFAMRPEQRRAVEQTARFFTTHSLRSSGRAPHFLWNAKMRFGKTFATYELAKAMDFTRVLVLTFKPAVKNAWEQDLRHRDFKGWSFISREGVSYEEIDKTKPFVWFASFQDVLGRNANGGIKVRNEQIHKIEWDMIVIDEYHFGAWNDNAKDLYIKDLCDEEREFKDEIEELENFDEESISQVLRTKAYLYLSGTPFRALSNGEFVEDCVFNWTYSDEQRAKREWGKENSPLMQGHSALSDKSGILHEELGHYRLGNSLRPSLENPDFSSQILECQENNLETKTNTESNTDSIQGFAQSNISAQSAETDSRPLRGAKNRIQGDSSVAADLELEAEIARLSPRLPKKKSGALSFSGLGRAGRGETPFSFALTSDAEKQKTIRENEILRNENLKSGQNQNLDSIKLIESTIAKDSNTHTNGNSKISDEMLERSEEIPAGKCGLQGKHEGSYLSGNDPKCFSPLPHLSQKAELPQSTESNLQNPYADLPEVIMCVYSIADSISQIAAQGEFDEFSLNEFFKAQNGEFKHKDEVCAWLSFIKGQYNPHTMLKTQKPLLPFFSTELLGALAHTFWFLPNVASCEAMAKLLERDSFFSEYRIILCAGKHVGVGEKALDDVKKQMGDIYRTKSITLSCGKLTTGVSVKAWSGIFMLRDCKSPESYFQAAFRVQTPWSVRDRDNVKHIIKEQCFVFDFAPNRALRQISDYATRLSTQTHTSAQHNVEEFISFLPVLMYDGNTMKQINATELLDISISGQAGSLLARKFESAMLVRVDDAILGRLLENKEIMEALSKIEAFRSLNKDIEHIISRTKDIKDLKSKPEKLDTDKKRELSQKEKEIKSKRKEIQDKLIKFASRIPIFMYLSDYREEALRDVIQKLEPELFVRVTGMEVEDFTMLCEFDVFNKEHFDSAIYAFKRYEDYSLEYVRTIAQPATT